MNDGPSAVRTADATFDEASLLHTREVMGQPGAFPSHVLCQGHDSHFAAVGLRKTHEHLKVLHRQLRIAGQLAVEHGRQGSRYFQSQAPYALLVVVEPNGGVLSHRASFVAEYKGR